MSILTAPVVGFNARSSDSQSRRKECALAEFREMELLDRTGRLPSRCQVEDAWRKILLSGESDCVANSR